MDNAVIESAEEILSAQDVEYAFVRSWNGKDVRLQSLTAGDLIEWSEANEGEAKRTAGLRLITKSVVGPEPENKLLLSEKHIGMLRGKSHRITENIVRAILKLNGMRTKAEDDNAAKKD